MTIQRLTANLVGLYLFLKNPESRSERGLSQTAETAILIGAAVAVATLIGTLVTKYVQKKMNGLP